LPLGLLLNPNDPNAERFIREAQETARAKNLELQILRVSTDNEIDGVFASLVNVARWSSCFSDSGSSLWQWQLAMPCRQSIRSVNLLMPAA